MIEMIKRCVKKVVSAAAAFVIASSGAAFGSDDGARERMYQVALLQSLMQGAFDGTITARELLTHGDIGIGTFHAIDGELIALDGVIYQARGDGSVVAVDGDITIPFSNVTFFDADIETTLIGAADISAMFDRLGAIVAEHDKNIFYMVRVDGKFDTMLVRSERGQTAPYPTLVEALERDQTEFEYADIEGTLVGLYCPSYAAGLNSAGWHFHFISKDRTRGGHVLDLSFGFAKASLDATRSFELYMPDQDALRAMDLARDMQKDIDRAETERQ